MTGYNYADLNTNFYRLKRNLRQILGMLTYFFETGDVCQVFALDQYKSSRSFFISTPSYWMLRSLS